MAWLKTPRGGLIPAALEREFCSCGIDWKVLQGSARTLLHTHVAQSFGANIGLSLPSIMDYASVARALQHGVTHWHVATVDDLGKVRGYVSFVPTAKFRELASRDNDSISALNAGCKDKVELNRRMREQGLVRLRVTPMPGFRYLPGVGLFVRKPE